MLKWPVHLFSIQGLLLLQCNQLENPQIQLGTQPKCSGHLLPQFDDRHAICLRDLSGGTVEAMGLSGLSKQAGVLMLAVPRDKILADIQFQGAISDFHPIKDALKAADYEELLLRINEDDVFGDGNNFEVAVTLATADAWVAADDAAQQATAAAAEAAVAAAGAAETAVLRRRRRRDPQPWQDQGSEVSVLSQYCMVFRHNGIEQQRATTTASARQKCAL